MTSSPHPLKLLVVSRFAERFAAPPKFVARAPGRVNLIGEHTDYNDGFVFPMAIDRAAWIAFSPTDDRIVQLHSLLYEETVRFPIDDLIREKGWAEYAKGVAWALSRRGVSLRGLRGIVTGDVPLGSGLSSSAALEIAVGQALLAAAGAAMDAASLARVGQEAENGWVGMNCGIMDQLASAAGEQGHALLIDCRSLECRPIPVPPEATVVILDTATRRELSNSAYNQRRAECERAAQTLGRQSLRDVSPEEFARAESKLDEVARRRARHVITEIDRTQRAATCFAAGDLEEVGRLMNLSHASLRDDYEVSSAALDAMSLLARETDGCFGARMTGAGFGGCAVALVRRDKAKDFAISVARKYERATGIKPAILATDPCAGAECLPVQ